MIVDLSKRMARLQRALMAIQDTDSWHIHVDDEVTVELPAEIMRQVIEDALRDAEAELRVLESN